MQEGLNIEVRDPKAGVTVIELSGPLDSSSAYELEQRIVGVVTKPVTLVLNLANVTTMTSAGMGVILTAALEARRYGGDIRLCAAASPAVKVMKLVGLFELFKVYDSEEDALKDL
jgi:anti-sigma B factor antagonist